MRRALALAVALVLVAGACAFEEPGAPPRPIATPQTITVTMADRTMLEASGREALTMWLANRCTIFVPPPRGYDDVETWRIWFHELRHCNGERHAGRNEWLP